MKTIQWVQSSLFFTLLYLTAAAYGVQLTDFQSIQIDENNAKIIFTFDGQPPETEVYQTSQPPRIIINLFKAIKSVPLKRYQINAIGMTEAQLISNNQLSRFIIHLNTPVFIIHKKLENQLVFAIRKRTQTTSITSSTTDKPAIKPLITPQDKVSSTDTNLISFNFQNINIREVINMIAEFTQTNIIVSEKVTGSLTLHLQDIPVDQILDSILKLEGLGKRQMKGILFIAPLPDIIRQEKIEKSVSKNSFKSKTFTLRYALAQDIQNIISEMKELTSDHGSMVVDKRTNSLLVQDTPEILKKISDLIVTLDVPIRQVLIEARIVTSRSSIVESLGVEWKEVAFNNQGFADAINGKTGVAQFTQTGTSLLSLGVQGSEALLDLELSALESEGKADLISRPRIITVSGVSATIQSGTQVPYEQSAGASGATSVSFKSATLMLQVTPLITANNNIIMKLSINQDSIGNLSTDAGVSIDTNSIQTEVLVSHGETIILGGILRSEQATNTSKVPFLSSIPLLGTLFKNTSHTDVSSELSVFITPKIADQMPDQYQNESL